MLRVKLLGQFNIQLDDQPVEIPSRPAQALFAYLILNAGTAYRREKLAGLIWPEASEANARSNLRHALWRIRKVLGADYLSADDLAIAFNADADYHLDVAELERETRSDTSAATVMACVDAYGGEFLPGFYEDWIALERERLQATFERKIEQLIDRLLAERRWREMIDWAERWIALGQVPEPAYRALMVAHYYLGNTAHVAAIYQRCVDALQKEIDVEPSPQTRALYQQLSKGQAPYGAPEPQSASPIEATRASGEPLPTRHNLPPQATPFIGRSNELAEIADRLQHDAACRLLNVIGPGGIGKTRLALQAANDQLANFVDGVFFVPLAPLTSAAAIAPAIAQALSLPTHGQTEPYRQVLDYVHDKQLLLVLDNFEHLLEGIDLLADILTTAPQVKLLVTSRERLHLQWEWILEIRGLDYPASDEEPQVEAFEAVQLFLQTARRMDAHFTLRNDRAHVIHICQLLEGSPLGIELAAAWVRVLMCQEIAQQIERNLDLLATASADRPERHRSLRAAFEYSWELLSQDEQKAFKKLAVFQGGFRREAAEKVAGAPLSLLFTLVDKSLLRRGASGRFEMHSLLRQFVTEKLNAGRLSDALNTTPIDLTRTRMAQYYLTYAHRHQSNYAALNEEWVNLMAGISIAHTHEMQRAVLDYADALPAAAFALGHFADMRRAGVWTINAAEALNDQRALAKCWRVWGQACIEQADYDEAHEHLTRSLDLCRQLGDLAGVAGVQYDLARIAIFRVEYDKARQSLADSQRILEALQDDRGLAGIYYRQATVAYYEREFTEADRLAQQALAIQRQLPDRPHGIVTLTLLAEIALHGRGNLGEAEQYCAQALIWCDELKNDSDRTTVLGTLAEVHRRQGNLDAARAEAETFLHLVRRMGDRKSQAHALFRLSQIDADRHDYAAAEHNAALSLELCRQLHDRWGEVYVAHHLGGVYIELRQPDDAHHLWLDALSLAESIQHPLIETLRGRLKQ
jgi:DNA-binding SARP family transcriptional activator/predicted ATPase